MASKQSLANTHPELALEAAGWDPMEVTAGSNKKKLWRCKKGHEWVAVVANRTYKKYGCPICSGQKIQSGFNDLATLHPEIAAQAFGWDPTKVALNSQLKMEWQCGLGHVWKSTVANRTRRGDGCSICSSHIVLKGFNDLATTDPQIALKAYGWDPSTLSRRSNKKVQWKCDQSHLWQAPPSNVVLGTGCPVCAGKVVLKGFNDLATLHPEIALQADGWDPSTVTVSSNKVLQWKCLLHHTWKTSVGNRYKGTGCPICLGQRVLVGFNDLATLHPEIALQADGWDPKTVTAGSTRKGANQWKCNLGHIWKATVAARTAGSGCPVCAGQKTWAGFNDLATTHPELAEQAFNWDPKTIMAGTEKRLEWKCRLGHVWKTRGAERKKGYDCPFCSGQRVLVGFNDLATTHPSIAEEAYGWNPQSLTAGSGLKRKFKCNEGHIWITIVGSRTSSKKSGCPTCSKTGFDPNSNGYLYFLVQELWDMYQIGITNFPDDRLNSHAKLGWEIIELRGPMDGLLTQHWETSILRMLRAKGADLSNSSIAGKFDGYSEAWSKSTFEVDSIQSLMRLTEEFEAKNLAIKKNKDNSLNG